MCVAGGRCTLVNDIGHGAMEVGTSYQVVGVNEYDRAMDYLRTSGVLSIAYAFHSVGELLEHLR
jgi:hypothetical protein